MTKSHLLEPLLTPEILLALIANGRRAEAAAKTADDSHFDPLPVVKIFTPDANATWLLTEADPHNPDMMFGLADTGQGFPELGWCSLKEIASVRGSLGLVVERDEHFRPDKTIKTYAAEAAALGRIET